MITINYRHKNVKENDDEVVALQSTLEGRLGKDGAYTVHSLLKQFEVEQMKVTLKYNGEVILFLAEEKVSLHVYKNTYRGKDTLTLVIKLFGSWRREFDINKYTTSLLMREVSTELSEAFIKMIRRSSC